MNFTFPKKEKLTSLKIIDALYSKGNFSLYSHPFKISFIYTTQQDASCKVLLSVPKRNFKRAVDRNLIKRQIREIYRLNKQTLAHLLASKQKSIALSIAYIAKKELHYSEADLCFKKLIEQLCHEIEKDN